MYTHIDQTGIVALTKIVKDGGLVEVCKSSHILNLLKLGWIHLLSHIQWHFNFL